MRRKDKKRFGRRRECECCRMLLWAPAFSTGGLIQQGYPAVLISYLPPAGAAALSYAIIDSKAKKGGPIMNYGFIVSYDGSRYEGWQRQTRTKDTIQGRTRWRGLPGPRGR